MKTLAIMGIIAPQAVRESNVSRKTQFIVKTSFRTL